MAGALAALPNVSEKARNRNSSIGTDAQVRNSLGAELSMGGHGGPDWWGSLLSALAEMAVHEFDEAVQLVGGFGVANLTLFDVFAQCALR